jgi:hypothetical protein
MIMGSAGGGGSRSRSKQKSRSQTFFQTTGGAYGGVGTSERKSKELARLAQRGLTGRSGYGQALQETLMPTGKYQAQRTPAEEQVLQNIISATQGASALRGIQPTQGQIARAVAPMIMDQRQQDIQNLQQALGMETGGLMDLIELAMPQTQQGEVAKARGTGRGKGSQVVNKEIGYGK